MYSEYPASDWHQIEHSRQPEVVQYQSYMGYHSSNAVTQPEMVPNGTYWQGDYTNGHNAIPNYAYHSNDRIHSPSDYSNDGSPVSFESRKSFPEFIESFIQMEHSPSFPNVCCLPLGMCLYG
jgi:hypothetical protein